MGFVSTRMGSCVGRARKLCQRRKGELGGAALVFTGDKMAKAEGEEGRVEGKSSNRPGDQWPDKPAGSVEVVRRAGCKRGKALKGRRD